MEKTANDVRGRLMVSEEVISTIAVNAVKEIEQVKGIKPQPKSLIGIMSKSSSGKQVSVGYVDDVVEISMNICVKSGCRATAVAAQVQESVKAAVQSMTGLTVARVNVTVGDISYE